MEIMEIILLIAGGLIFILSFFIPEGKGSSGGGKGLSEEEINQLLAQELGAMRCRIDRLLQETAEETMEKTERSLEKLSNEKIMAVSEYSDTVLKEIHGNHEEAMFLYDMLNNKHANLKNVLGEINQAVEEAEKAMESLKKMISGEEIAETVVSEAAVSGGVNPLPGIVSGGAEFYHEGTGGENLGNAGNGLFSEAEEQSTFSETEGQERNNNVKILALYRQGKTVVDIAKELGLGVGEVNLVVDLFKK